MAKEVIGTFENPFAICEECGQEIGICGDCGMEYDTAEEMDEEPLSVCPTCNKPDLYCDCDEQYEKRRDEEWNDRLI